MNVSPAKPFKLIYSLFQHEYLGYLFESFVVSLDDQGRLTLRYQNISSKNAAEFDAVMNEDDYELVKLMDSIQQDQVIKKFSTKKTSPEVFYPAVYDSQKGNKAMQDAIEAYIEMRRSKILALLKKGKTIYTMARDGNPAQELLIVQEEPATVHFHFRRDQDGTNYFPTIKHAGSKLEFQDRNARVICNEPAWLMLDNKLYQFQEELDGKKLRPFLAKKFISIPKKMEETYYERFIAQLLESFHVVAVGFDIHEVKARPLSQLLISEVPVAAAVSPVLFGGENTANEVAQETIVFSLTFSYQGVQINGDKIADVSVKIEKNGDDYVFHKVRRDTEVEDQIKKMLIEKGLMVRNGKAIMPKHQAISWLNEHLTLLQQWGIEIKQKHLQGKRYFLGQASIEVKIEEKTDWFDVNALVRFGEYVIPFAQLRKLILANKREFLLPNGEIAVIPDAWLTQYSDLIHFLEDMQGGHLLSKHHLALVSELAAGNLAQVTIDAKLEALRNFSEIEDFNMPSSFQGELRPYQKAGYNWLQFLNQYGFGGCLADDMGLGKTVQTLALLLAQKEEREASKEAGKQPRTSLLIMPTSLLYNWEQEANKFTPQLKIYAFTGSNRPKDLSVFDHFDLILTSYGIARIDAELLEKYYFNYVILDESQVIKNPNSNITKIVMRLKSRRRLLLTGTPLENSTMDLWAQMSFANPGLLGTQNIFRRDFQIPIEKKQDTDRSKRLYAIIKPFILRRHKSQVAHDLPEKVEHLAFCEMSAEQAELYEKTKSFFRNKILEHIDGNGVAKAQFMLLQGLTMLRQIANHPKMVEEGFEGDSGKMEDVLHKIESALIDNHKILVFSQFVKHLTLLRAELDKRGITYAYLDGAVKDRKEEVERFQSDTETKLFLISLKAGGVGLNLTAADYVFILDPWWNPAVEAQAIDRAHRIGQVNTVFTYKFIARNTVEEKILALQQSKMKLAADLITTEESFMKSLSKEDINSLLA